MKYFFFLLIYVFLTTYCLAQEKDKMKGIVADYSMSGDAQLVSHFIVKGLSYSDNNPAMGASFLANLGSQVKMGVWGSNVSNLTAADDNFWLKIFAKIKIDFANGLLANAFLQDNHFYKSNQRNGQNLGIDFSYKIYEFGLEWMSNVEGTRTNAEYFWFGQMFDYKKNLRYGGNAGWTNSHTSMFQSYFNFKILGQYLISTNSNAEIGLTFNSSSSQFGIRDDPSLFTAIKLYY